MNRPKHQSDKMAILILGVQRSGTSALTRTLSMGGLELPKTLIEPNPLNPLGFWESDVFLKHHRQILAACGSGLTDILPIRQRLLASAPVRQLEADLEDALVSEFGEAKRCLIKDPRICRLFPVWKRLLGRLGWQCRVIIPVRHPAEVIGSMKHQGHVAGLRGQLVWLQGFLAAEQASRGMRRSFITFDQLLEDPTTQVTRLSDDLSLNLEFNAEARDQIKQFLSHRPRNRANEKDRDRQVIPMCRAAFNWAQAQAGGAPSSVRIKRLQMGYRLGASIAGPLLRTRRWILENTRERTQSEEKSARR